MNRIRTEGLPQVMAGRGKEPGFRGAGPLGLLLGCPLRRLALSQPLGGGLVVGDIQDITQHKGCRPRWSRRAVTADQNPGDRAVLAQVPLFAAIAGYFTLTKRRNCSRSVGRSSG